jgi:hypothetical protein
MKLMLVSRMVASSSLRILLSSQWALGSRLSTRSNNRWGASLHGLSWILVRIVMAVDLSQTLNAVPAVL